MGQVSQPKPKNSEASFSETASTFREGFEELGKVAGDSIHQIKREIQDYVQKGQEKVSQIENKVEGTIQHYPLRALAIAVGVGFLIGWILRK